MLLCDRFESSAQLFQRQCLALWLKLDAQEEPPCIQVSILLTIDDEPADRIHDTRTLPTRIGGEGAWRAAMLLRLVLAASLLIWPVGPFAPRAAWAGFSALSTILLRWWRPPKIRDLVDARFGVEAACVGVALLFTP